MTATTSRAAKAPGRSNLYKLSPEPEAAAPTPGSAAAPISAPLGEDVEQMYLRQVEVRISGLRVNHPGSPEIERMLAARADIWTRMTEAGRAAYEKAATAVKTRDELKAEAEAERIAMEANRDKPAI
jgi:hypothetical protein